MVHFVNYGAVLRYGANLTYVVPRVASGKAVLYFTCFNETLERMLPTPGILDSAVTNL